MRNVTVATGSGAVYVVKRLDEVCWRLSIMKKRLRREGGREGGKGKTYQRLQHLVFPTQSHSCTISAISSLFSMWTSTTLPNRVHFLRYCRASAAGVPEAAATLATIAPHIYRAGSSSKGLHMWCREIQSS